MKNNMKLHVNNNGDLTFISKYFMIDSDSKTQEFYFRIGDVNKQHFSFESYERFFEDSQLITKSHFYIELNVKLLPEFIKYFNVGKFSFKVLSYRYA